MNKISTLLLAVLAVGFVFVLWIFVGQAADTEVSAHPEDVAFEEPEELAQDSEVLELKVENSASRSVVPDKPEPMEESEVKATNAPKTAEAAEVDKVEEAAGQIEVSVVDTAGKPVVGARVRASDIAEDVTRTVFFGGTKRSAKTDENGIAILTGLELGLMRVEARIKGFAPGTTDVVTITSSKLIGKAKIVLTEGGAVEGLLRDVDGAPASNVRISVHLSAWPDALDTSMPSVMRAFKTKADGTFRVEQLTPGDYNLYTRAKKDMLLTVPNQSAKFKITEGQTTTVQFKDSSGSYVKLSGVILRNGEPFPLARLSFSWEDRSQGYLGKSTQADKEGRFQVILEEGGDYRVQVSGKLGSIFHLLHVPSVPSHEVEIAFDTGSIRGHVLGPQGKPQAGISVLAMGRTKSEKGVSTAASVKSDSEGAFEFPNLWCATYSLSAMERDHAPIPLEPSSQPHFGPGKVSKLAIGPGDKLVDVDINLGAAAGIEGHVLDSQGDPALAALISCRPVQARGLVITAWKVDSKGRYLVGGLKQGDHWVRAVQQRQVSDWIRVTTILNETVKADLKLEQGTMLNLTASTGGQPAKRSYVRVKDAKGRIVASDILKGGATQLGPLFPGTYVVIASISGETKLEARQEFQVAGEPSTSVDLTLQ